VHLLTHRQTDKVTIEAKSPQAGTIAAIHVEVGQTVEVGGKFFTLTPGGEAPAAAAAAAPTAAAADTAAAPAAPAAAAAAAATAARIHPSGRPSLISFPPRGAAAAAAAPASPAAPAAAAAAPIKPPPAAKPPPVGTISYDELPLRFRPKEISEEEMAAIESGGADVTF
jgi:pyruvate dehydrogenase E2 component (dihydrolipoamide acetyltransferase)